jgi:hypothetical protein
MCNIYYSIQKSFLKNAEPQHIQRSQKDSYIYTKILSLAKIKIFTVQLSYLQVRPERSRQR